MKIKNLELNYHFLTKFIHVMGFKRASGRFSFHFREGYQKCIEYIVKFLIQVRETSKFW